MYESSSNDRTPHPFWRFLAITFFAGLFVLGVAMVFNTDRRSSRRGQTATSAVAAEDERIPRVESVEEGLTFTDEQQDLISATQDRTGWIGEPALYLLLRHAASLPELSAEQMNSLASPDYDSLLEYPSRHRARPVRTQVQPVVVEKQTPDAGLGRSQHWPGDRPVWRIDGLNVRGKVVMENEPVLVFSVADPTEMLGEPTRTDDDGRMVFEDSFTIESAGVFYKVWTAESRGDEDRPAQRMDYPVVVAWQLRHAPGGPSGPAGDTLQALIMFIAVALLLIMFFYMRRRNREEPSPTETYRPRRNEQPEQPDNEAEIDPDLRAAAEAAKEHRKDDDADSESSTG